MHRILFILFESLTSTRKTRTLYIAAIHLVCVTYFFQSDGVSGTILLEMAHLFNIFALSVKTFTFSALVSFSNSSFHFLHNFFLFNLRHKSNNTIFIICFLQKKAHNSFDSHVLIRI